MFLITSDTQTHILANLNINKNISTRMIVYEFFFGTEVETELVYTRTPSHITDYTDSVTGFMALNGVESELLYTRSYGTNFTIMV